MSDGDRLFEVPSGIPAGVLDAARLQRIVDELSEAPLDLADWAALKVHLVAVWPRDPWWSAGDDEQAPDGDPSE